MAENTQELPPSRRVHELHRGIVQALGAIGYLATQVDHLSMCFAFIPEPVPGAREEFVPPMREALAHLNSAMNVLGDYLNASDSVEARDIAATREAFALARTLLKETSLGT